MTQGARGGASKPCEHGLILIVTGLADALPDDVQTLKAMLLAERARADRLSQIIKELQRHRFGRRAETLPIEQMELGLEDVQQGEAAAAAQTEAKDPAVRAAKARERRTNRGALPAHLPRFEVVVEPQSLACPCCSGTLHRIGEDVAERLDIIPAQIRVLVTRRPWLRSPRRSAARRRPCMNG